MTVFRRHGNAELWSCFQKKLAFLRCFQNFGRVWQWRKTTEAPARQVLGGKHINCRGPRTEPWGTSFQPATETQALHRQPLSVRRTCFWIHNPSCVSVCIHVCNCLLKVNWSIARKESRLTAIRVQVPSYLLPDRNLQRPAAEIMNSLQTFFTHTQGSIYSHWKERSLWSLS